LRLDKFGLFPRYCTNILKVWWIVLVHLVENFTAFLAVKEF